MQHRCAQSEVSKEKIVFGTDLFKKLALESLFITTTGVIK
jgi:hypothetical protein